MQLVESVIKRKLQKRIQKHNFKAKDAKTQEETLRHLLNKAKNTSFGKCFLFDEILTSGKISRNFQEKVPVFDYEKMYNEWWCRLFNGEENVSWPGKVRYFGLTSGTSNDSSKRVPVTYDMIKAMQKTGTRQLFVLAKLDLPQKFLKKKILMLGGSTDLVKVEDYFEGDLSGILTGRLPLWFNNKYKPGKQISRIKDWNMKLDEMVKHAPKWDIGGIAGVPAWVQMLMERIIDHYGLQSIHDIWPNFCVYSHGGVSFEPYQKSFNKLLSKRVCFLETYLASEGFIAYQTEENSNMQLVLDNGIFFEFVPFTHENFDQDGNIKSEITPLLLEDVEENTEYAILISTVSGTWRYLIGDTIKFTSVEQSEIIITGRTKHFLSLCGEHLSVDNMNQAIRIISDKLNLNIKEFTVAGTSHESFFAHKWYLGIDNSAFAEKDVIKKLLDDTLKKLNDDYCVERSAALKEIFVELVPNNLFYEWMKIQGKIGGQHKFPRVLNGKHKEWEGFLKEVNILPSTKISRNLC